jgi:hypothetical protein
MTLIGMKFAWITNGTCGRRSGYQQAVLQAPKSRSTISTVLSRLKKQGTVKQDPSQVTPSSENSSRSSSGGTSRRTPFTIASQASQYSLMTPSVLQNFHPHLATS